MEEEGKERKVRRVRRVRVGRRVPRAIYEEEDQPFLGEGNKDQLKDIYKQTEKAFFDFPDVDFDQPETLPAERGSLPLIYFFPDYLREIISNAGLNKYLTRQEEIAQRRKTAVLFPILTEQCKVLDHLWEQEKKMERAWGHSRYQSKGYMPSYLCPGSTVWMK